MVYIDYSQTDFKRKRNGMLGFVKKVFRDGINVLLWINLILWTIAGGVAGYFLGALISYRNAGGYAFGGVLIGIICGLLIDIVGGGFITTILSIEKNTEEQTALLKKSLGINNNAGDNVSKVVLELKDPYKTIDSVNIREKPELTSSYVFRLNYNETVSVIETGEKISDTNYWIHVKTKDGKDGWCYSNTLEKIV
jgi:hypothetical protein